MALEQVSNRGEAHLELNAFRRKHDCALVISGDSLEVLQCSDACSADDVEGVLFSQNEHFGVHPRSGGVGEGKIIKNNWNFELNLKTKKKKLSRNLTFSLTVFIILVNKLIYVTQPLLFCFVFVSFF